VTTSNNLPDKLSLKPSRLKWAVMLLISLAFVATGLFIIPPDEDPMMRALAIGFFSICALASIPGLMGVGGLDLDREGFTISTIGRKTRRSWRECSEFSVLNMRGGLFVGFSSETDSSKAAAAISRTLVGESGMLPDKYGMKAKDLAGLMNRFRARALH
jgi:hypothetical protein